MAKGISLQQVSSVIGKAIANKKGITPAQIITSEAVGSARKIGNDLFGFDFVGLGLKLFIYFTIAFVFAKFMEAVIFTRGIVLTLGNLLGFQVPKPEEIPDSIKKLFDGGISGFKFWDIIKIVAILLVIAEFMRYVNSNRKIGSPSSPTTIGVFILIISILAVTTIPELFKRIKTTDFSLESFR